MKQIAQNLRTGETLLQEIPAPLVKKGCILIKTKKSLISTGTERMLVEFSKGNLLRKAYQNPEKLAQVIGKIRRDGLLATVKAVSYKMGQLLPLGYCNVGEVIAVGQGVDHFRVGDRVVSNGPHAEIVRVPKHLAARIPANVSDEEATFTILGSIGLQGIRLLSPALGETVVVIGLGVIGLLTAELLRINGCRVIGIEPDNQKLKIASEAGIVAKSPEDVDIEKWILEITNGVGADGVLIAAASGSNRIISQAASITRKRGKIVLIGSIGLKLNRADFYEKELSFQVSCSYGPGRYDTSYEQNGTDYPIEYVRWTENRNFEAILQLLSAGSLRVKPLISKVIDLSDFEKAYADLNTGIATLINYPEPELVDRKPRPKGSLFPPTDVVIGIIGAGNFSRMTMLPILKKASIKCIASSGGLSAVELAEKYNIPIATANYEEILNDREIDLVLIATRHNDHAHMVIEALNAKSMYSLKSPWPFAPKNLRI